MHRFEGPSPWDHAPSRREWFNTPDSSWTTEDKKQARRCLEEKWKQICGDVPAHITTRPEVAAARERVLGEWSYNGNSLAAFVEHCMLHLRTLMYVLYREKDDTLDQSGVQAAHERLSSWFREHPVLNDFLSTTAAIIDRQSGAAGAATHIWVFCETDRAARDDRRADLWDVITTYAADKGSAWNFAKTLFGRHVAGHAQLDAPPPPRVVPVGKPPVTSKRATSEPHEPEPTIDVVDSDERARKRAGETRRFLAAWDSDLTRREKEKKRARKKSSKRNKEPKKRPSGERLQYLALILCYRYWPGEAPLIDEAGGLRSSEDTDHENETEAVYERIANELEITRNYVKVSIHRARLYVLDGLRRYPVRVEVSRRQDVWHVRVRLNRFAVWDTVVLLSCTPTDHARLSSPIARVGSCDDYSEAITLTTDLRESAPTALTFPRAFNTGETATGELRMNQWLIRATANGRSVEEWVHLRKQGPEAGTQVQISQTAHDAMRGDPMPLAVRVGKEWHSLPITLNVAPSHSNIQVEFDTSHASSQPAGLEFVPAEVIGGDATRAVVTLGVRLTAHAGADPPAIGLLPIAPPSSCDGTLSSQDPRLPLRMQWQGSQAQVMLDLTTNRVPEKAGVEVVARLSQTIDSSPVSAAAVSGTLTLLPPVLRSLKLLDVNRRQVSRIRPGGRAVGASFTFDRPVVKQTKVAITTSHRGVHVKSPLVVKAGKHAAAARVTVADDALAGKARIVGTANGTTLSTHVDVAVNRFVMSFTPYTLVPGSVATGTIRFEEAVSKAVKFELSIENDGTGGRVRVKKGEKPRPLVAFSQKAVAIAAGQKEAHFAVRPQVPVQRRVRVVIVAKGLGAQTSAKVSLAPRARRQKLGEALADGA